MHRRAFLVCILATTGCLEVFEENGEEIIQPEDVAIEDAELVRENPNTDEERVYVWGVARNEADRRLTLVEIRATFLDDAGEVLETVIENVPDVTVGDEWVFEIEFPDFGERASLVDSFDLEVVTAV